MNMSQLETVSPENSGVSIATTVMMTALKLVATFPPLRTKIQAHNLPIVDTTLYIAERLRCYRAAWVSHPQYAEWRQDPELAWMPFDDPAWAMVVVALKHPPGIDKREYSFMICDTSELPNALHWSSTPKVGDFAGVIPISENFYGLPYRYALYSWSVEGKARGYLAREAMKQLLPRKLRKYVNLYRGSQRSAKYEYLRRPTRLLDGDQYLIEFPHGMHIKDWLKENRASLPDWYKARDKAQLWSEWLAVTEPVLWAQINYWIDVVDFYRAVTGQIHPEDVRPLFRRLPKTAIEMPVQLPMF